jgi:hypothetical protein
MYDVWHDGWKIRGYIERATGREIPQDFYSQTYWDALNWIIENPSPTPCAVNLPKGRYFVEYNPFIEYSRSHGHIYKANVGANNVGLLDYAPQGSVQFDVCEFMQMTAVFAAPTKSLGSLEDGLAAR